MTQWAEIRHQHDVLGIPKKEIARRFEIDVKMLRQRVPHAPGKRRRGPQQRRRSTWAELLRRVFLLEILVCARCGGRRRVLAAIQDPESIRKVLGSLEMSAAVPELAAARSPPRQGDLEFVG